MKKTPAPKPSSVLTPEEAVATLESSALGDGVWAKQGNDEFFMEMVAIRVAPGKAEFGGKQWLVTSRMNGEEWDFNRGTPYDTAQEAVDAIASGASTKQFRPFVNDRVVK